MKIFKFLLVTVTSFLFFFSQSALAVYGTDDVPHDNSEKIVTHGAEVEVIEFVYLKAMPDIELHYHPYSATKADQANNEDAPGTAGSVYVGGGVIEWHANIDTTISIDDLVLTHIDTGVTERNEIAVTNGTGISIGSLPDPTATGFATQTFDNSDLAHAYGNRNVDYSTMSFDTDNGFTYYSVKFFFAVTLAEAGLVQSAGSYRATVTIRAIPNVS